MMKNIFLIVIFVACGLEIQAQEAFSESEKNRTSSEVSQDCERLDYRPMLVDGKSWRYLSHHFEDEADGSYTETTSTYENILDGDTLIGDVSYRKMYAKIIASGNGRGAGTSRAPPLATRDFIFAAIAATLQNLLVISGVAYGSNMAEWQQNGRGACKMAAKWQGTRAVGTQ